MKLYKYTRFSEHLLASLAKETIWVSSPEKFNDIFDCKSLLEDLSIDQAKELYHIKKYRNKNSNNFPLKITEDHLTEDGIKKLCSEHEHEINIFINNFGIYSLSERPDSLLLWAHYASDHHGVCLEYEGDSKPEY